MSASSIRVPTGAAGRRSGLGDVLDREVGGFIGRAAGGVDDQIGITREHRRYALCRRPTCCYGTGRPSSTVRDRRGTSHGPRHARGALIIGPQQRLTRTHAMPAAMLSAAGRRSRSVRSAWEASSDAVSEGGAALAPLLAPHHQRTALPSAAPRTTARRWTADLTCPRTSRDHDPTVPLRNIACYMLHVGLPRDGRLPDVTRWF